MGELITIHFDDLRFYAFHGVYEEERKSGNEFIVDLTVSFQPQSGTITGISDTVDYASLYGLIKKEMQQPRDLLETFAMETVEKIHLAYPLLKKIDLSITKLQPPMAGFQGTVAVRHTKDFQ